MTYRERVASLADLSRDIADLVERCGASVVQVDGRRGRLASGVVWADNLVLTADHVLEHEDHIGVAVGAAAVKASIVGRDSGTDLALLKTEGLKAPAAARGGSTDSRSGQIVLALGRPGGLRVTVGIISGMTEAFRSWRGGETERLIQTTAALLPGFSGGPLIDAGGRVIGINSWNFGGGVSRALPVETAERVAESLKTHGRIRRAYLGLGMQPVRLIEALKSQLGQDSGLLVVTVEPGGPAARAGMLQGDTVVAFDGTAVRELDEVFRALQGLAVGSSHTLRVARAGELKDLTVTTGERAP